MQDGFVATYGRLLRECGRARLLSEGKVLHERIRASRYHGNTLLANSLVHMYGKCGCVQEARRVFDGSRTRNIVSWNTAVSAFAECSLESSKRAFELMPCRDLVSWNAMVTAFSQNGRVQEAKGAFDSMPGKDSVSWNTLLVAYAQEGLVQDVKWMFEMVPERNSISWNLLVTALSIAGQLHQAKEVFMSMPSRDVVSWNGVLSAFARNGEVEEAATFLERMPERDSVSWNAMLTGFSQSGRMDDAEAVFDRMPEKDVLSWNCMITANAQNGLCGEAATLFSLMDLEGVAPDLVSYMTIFDVCAEIASVVKGRAVHDAMNHDELEKDVRVGTSILHMYGKCGCVDEARAFFDRMSARNIFSWNAAIAAFSQNGMGKEALELFWEMCIKGEVQPNRVTFVSILSACGNKGLLLQGCVYLGSMQSDFGVKVEIEHYVCMVAVLARSGQLQLADLVRRSMPFEPDERVWRAMLGGCRVHRDEGRGLGAAKNASQLSSPSSSMIDGSRSMPFVVLSNIHAAVGNFDRVGEVRKAMFDNGVKKQLGWSSIEVGCRVHRFMVGDRTHSRREEIYRRLKLLHSEIEAAGYVPDCSEVLCGANETKKAELLAVHSERLAIAFGLISTTPGSPLRVVKSLRVCNDCHSAVKIMSSVTARRIVVRDASRFHHFEHGACSCGDYW